MDRPALPVFPSRAHAQRAALYRDDHHRRGAARRSRAAACVRPGRASGRGAAWRLGPARAGRMCAHLCRHGLRRDQSQCRLSVGPRAGRPLRRVPDGGAAACRRLRRRHEGGGAHSGHGEMPHRHRSAGPGGIAGCADAPRGRGRCRRADRSRAQGVARRPVAAREPRYPAARLRSRLSAQARQSHPAHLDQRRHRQRRKTPRAISRTSTA